MTMTLVAHYGGVGRMCSRYENKQFTNAKKKYSSKQGCGGNVDFDKQKEGGQSGLKALKRSKTVSLSFFFLNFIHIICTSISFHIHFLFFYVVRPKYIKK